jgi:hypothetical protein
VAALAAAGPAQAAEVTSWGAYGDEWDFITGGRSRVLHPGNTEALRATLDQWGDYGAHARPADGSYAIYLTYARPQGQPLRPYNYVGVTRMPFHEDWHARDAAPGRQPQLQQHLGPRKKR